jgi:hypothetical protein
MGVIVARSAVLVVLAQQGEPESRKGRLDAAAAPPAETSIISGATPLFMPFFLVATAEWLAHLRA